MGMVLNWQCTKCNKKLPKVVLPIICSCGTITKCDGTVEFGPQTNRPKITGANLWLELHNYKYTTEEEARAWLTQWESRLSCGTCKQHWASLMAVNENQPNFSSAYEFFTWGFKMHNIVNQTLGKPLMSLEEAKKVYNIVSPS